MQLIVRNHQHGCKFISRWFESTPRCHILMKYHIIGAQPNHYGIRNTTLMLFAVLMFRYSVFIQTIVRIGNDVIIYDSVSIHILYPGHEGKQNIIIT